jgi:hypothetical protein
VPGPVDRVPLMFRCALVLLAALSLLLCACSVTLVVRSIRKYDRFQARVAGRPYALHSRSGRVSVWGGSHNLSELHPGWATLAEDVGPSLPPWESDAPGPVSSKWEAPGFGYARGWYSGDGAHAGRASYRMVTFPAWAAAILTAMLPSSVFPRLWRDQRRSRRTASGRCYACGCDVRHSPDRCEECGTPVLHAARRRG